ATTAGSANRVLSRRVICSPRRARSANLRTLAMKALRDSPRSWAARSTSVATSAGKVMAILVIGMAVVFSLVGVSIIPPRAAVEGRGARSVRVLRGGTWGLGPVYARCAYRALFEPTFVRSYLGFRWARSPRRS